MTIEVTDAGRNEYEALVRDAKRWRFARTIFDASDVVAAVDWFDTLGATASPDAATDEAVDKAIAAAYKKRQEGK